jgi:hypothetical protein
LVVGLVVLLAITFAAYFALGMPGMDHSGDEPADEMEDMDHPRPMGTTRR